VTFDARFTRNVLLKALLLFLAANLVFVALRPQVALGRISAYNHLFPGRQRFPYGENPERAYNLNLFNLEAMFASHELDGAPKSSQEYRVLLIGDSSTWGFLLPADQTLAAYLNKAHPVLSDGRQVRVYNLGYPVMSLTKDLLILSRAMRYEPDCIVWLLTLESFPYDKQLYPPLLQNNPDAVRELIQTNNLSLNPYDPALKSPSFWDETIIGQRRPLADLLRLQLYGVMWAATGVDQDIPATYTPRQEDLSEDLSFHNLNPPHLAEKDLALDVLEAGLSLAGETPVLVVNEPMFISQGRNSELRYNFFYPRWAYDDYRRILQDLSEARGWHYMDAWDAVPSAEFTNSAVHTTSAGVDLLAQKLGTAILDIVNQHPAR
jgi:hypothetical protein